MNKKNLDLDYRSLQRKHKTFTLRGTYFSFCAKNSIFVKYIYLGYVTPLANYQFTISLHLQNHLNNHCSKCEVTDHNSREYILFLILPAMAES